MVKTSSRLPALFVSHGSPMFALEAGSTGPALARWGAALPDGLRGVVVMSPHWMAPTARVGTHPAPPTWHDFGGFPSALYTLDYPAPGDAALAAEVLALLRAAGIDAANDADRPRDHGAWVPLMHLLPAADVPVVQLALPQHAGPVAVLALGCALAPLRDAGVLLVGSGSLTHNLREFFGGAPVIDAPVQPYVAAFQQWIGDAVARGDVDALLAYRVRAPHADRAHPTDEHFLPIFFALGAGGFGRGDAAVESISREVMYGSLAMDAFAVGEAVSMK